VSWFPEPSTQPPLSKGTYRQEIAHLRQGLLAAQAKLLEAPHPLIVLLAGVDGAGKSETVTALNAWMDPHWLRTHAFDDPSDEERERPAFWRYWRALPPRGRTAIFLSAWYSEPLLRRAYGDEGPWFGAEVNRIRRFEALLADSGVPIVKVWLHLDHEAQRRRLLALERDPLQSWRVTARDWHHWHLYDRFIEASKALLDATHSDHCSWRVIDGADPRRREIEVAQALLEALGSPRSAKSGSRAADRRVPEAAGSRVRIGAADGSKPLPGDEYRMALGRSKARLNRLHRRAGELGIPLVAVFEGRDASGKGGAIRRVMSALDARMVHVVRTGPPTEQEQRHHYLWRFWSQLPRAGRVTLFDRSWYGRVLVERVEGFATPEEWGRAYAEINDFEEELVLHGTALAKFWLELDRKEQARRFKERRKDPLKRWKLTEDDERDRKKWGEYGEAIEEMLLRTHTEHAPWTEIDANDKRATRVTVIDGIADALERQIAAREAASRSDDDSDEAEGRSRATARETRASPE